MRNATRIYIVILVITVYFSFFHALGSVPLFDEDEGAFSEATREMMQSGNYLITYLDGKLRFDKPILTYWLQAASVKLFGLNEFAFRLPSALAAAFWALALFLFVRRFYDVHYAFLSTFFMITALQVTVIAKAAIADSLLNLFIAASMFSLYRFYQSDRKKHLHAAFLFCALGTLTKGPVAILIPVAVSCIFFLLKREFKRWLRAMFDPVGLAIFAVVALPWYVLAYREQGQAFIQGFFFKHNISRFRTSFEGHAGSLIYYVPVVLAGLLPYTTLLLKGVTRVRTIIKDDLPLFCGVWFSFVLVFFSLSGTKLPHYVIYGYTPLFILLPRFIDQVKTKWRLLLPAVILLVLLAAAPLAMGFVAGLIRDEFAAIVIRAGMSYIGWAYWAAVLGALIVVVVCLGVRSITRERSLLVAGFVLVLLVNLYLMPLAGAVMQQPVKDAAMIAKKHDYDVVMWKITVYSFLVYTEKLAPRRAPKPGEIVLTRANKLNRLKSYDVLFEKNGVVLARVNETF